MSPRDGEQGAALLVVLALVSTLSFIVLAIGQSTVRLADRTAVLRSKDALTWASGGVDALAGAAIEAAFREAPEKLTLESPLLARPLEAPMEWGYARIVFEDRTGCFNINSLVTQSDAGAYAGDEAAREELAAVISAAGVPAGGESDLAAVVTDWIDANTLQEPGGAEDSHYSALPTPYHTGATLLADISELRAMAGVTRARYAVVLPYLCAQPEASGAVLNLNLMTPADAPLLSGLLQGRLPVSAAADIIRNRPPGGFSSVEEFWTNPLVAALEPAEGLKSRTSLVSRYIGARAEIVYGEARILLDMTYEVEGGGRARLISRRFGWSEE